MKLGTSIRRMSVGVIIGTAIVMIFSIWYATRDYEYRSEYIRERGRLKECVLQFKEATSAWPPGKEDLMGCLTHQSRLVDWNEYTVKLVDVHPQTVDDREGELAIYEYSKDGKLKQMRIGTRNP